MDRETKLQKMLGLWHEPPHYLVNAHVQTIWPALRYAGHWPGFKASRVRWSTPDGDFIDIDRVNALETTPTVRPLLVLFHGLEGSIRSHYAQGFAFAASRLGFDFALPHFRGCAGDLNLAPRAYHSGDHEEVDWILRRLKAESPGRPMVAVGVSLGGNVLMLWAGVQRQAAKAVVQAVAAVSAPLDLRASGLALGTGFNLHVYTRMFLRTMRDKALAKWNQHPGLFDRERVMQARDLHGFDDAFTAPVHGYSGADDYWARASAKPYLDKVAVPSLLLNAQNDPFVPYASLPTPESVSPSVQLWQPRQGGHVGFPGRCKPLNCGFQVQGMPLAVLTWLKDHAAG